MATMALIEIRKRMLKEYPASQNEEEPGRRWFSDDYFDIIVWLDHAEAQWRAFSSSWSSFFNCFMFRFSSLTSLTRDWLFFFRLLFWRRSSSTAASISASCPD